MKNRMVYLCITLGVFTACGGDVVTRSSVAESPVTGELRATPLDIQCNEGTTVTVTLAAGVGSRATDVMLVLDRSGSMQDDMGALKSAAKAFVDKLDESTDGVRDGIIANGNRIGVVSFSSGATLDRPLTSNALLVKAAIDGLSAGGSTNHWAGITTAQGQLAPTPNDHLMILFTDGVTTSGPNPYDAAAQARGAGTEIFGIGLGDGVNQNEIRSWVSDPKNNHAYFTTDPGALQRIFEEIAEGLTAPAATNVRVLLASDSRFSVSNTSASKGAVASSQQLITWSINQLLSETVTLSYVATHDAFSPGGVVPLLAWSQYSDNEGNSVVFAPLSINVHGCAAKLELTPKEGTHVVGEEHTVIAQVLDDFDDPVADISVNFSVTGGTSIVDGEPSAPSPETGSGITDANGQTPFTYTNSQATTDTITATALIQPRVHRILTDTAQHTWTPIPAVIDIKPGSDPSSFGANSKGTIPVALFGDARLDVTLIDDASVRFGDAPSPVGDAPVARGALEAVNGDGFIDKVYHFYFPATHLDPSDGYGCLAGEVHGLDFMGCSDVNIVPNRE